MYPAQESERLRRTQERVGELKAQLLLHTHQIKTKVCWGQVTGLLHRSADGEGLYPKGLDLTQMTPFWTSS